MLHTVFENNSQKVSLNQHCERSEQLLFRKCISIFVTNILIPKIRMRHFLIIFKHCQCPARLIRQWPQKRKLLRLLPIELGDGCCYQPIGSVNSPKRLQNSWEDQFYFYFVLQVVDHQSSPLVFSKECQIWTDAFFCLALFFLSLRHENWRVHRAQNTGNIIKPGGTRRAPVSCQTSISALFSRGLSGMQKIVNYRGSIVHRTRQKLWVAVRSAKHGTKNSEASSFVKKGGHDKKMILGAWIMHVDLSLVILSSGFTSHLFLLVYYWIFSVRRK